MRYRDQQAEIPEACKHITCAHGEGPASDPKRNSLLWLDLEGFMLYRLNIGRGTLEKWEMPERVSKAVPHSSGDLLLFGNRIGICRFNPKSGSMVPVKNEARWFSNKVIANDAGVDPRGRFWFGTMHAEEKPLGALWRINQNGAVKRILPDVTISNGIVWDYSYNNWSLYYIDSPTQQIVRWNYDIVSGDIDTRRGGDVVYSFSGNHYPDGMTIDANHNLLVAVWGGGQVLRINPTNGRVLQKITTPGATQSSACCWGGPRLDHLYITTSQQGMNEEALQSEPNAGKLFVCRPGGRGIEETECDI